MQELATATIDDFVLPFRIEGAGFSGRLVRLGSAVDRALKAHDYPLPVSMLLGEALTLVALIGAGLKFEGTLTLQAQGDGPVSMLVADYCKPGLLRGYASFSLDAPAIAATKPVDGAKLLGGGHFALTIDPRTEDSMKRYQGIIPLENTNLADCALSYFLRSEQIPTRIRTAVGPAYERNKDGLNWRAGGIIVQRLAQEGGIKNLPSATEDDWSRVCYLLDTLEDHELLDPLLASERLLLRLFHEDGVRVFTQHDIAFGCQCNEERLQKVLTSFGRQDLQDLALEGVISARCEFCNREYRFGLDDLLK